MNKRFQLSYYLRIALNVVVYTIFFAYIIYSAATAGDGGGRLAYVAVGVFFGGGALLYEYLRFCFDEATRQLVFAGNPKKALALARRVKKADLLKTFDTSLDIMRMLAYVDLRAYEEAEGAELRARVTAEAVQRAAFEPDFGAYDPWAGVQAEPAAYTYERGI